jgi:NADH-quinone oxidoreductase subunit M
MILILLLLIPLLAGICSFALNGTVAKGITLAAALAMLGVTGYAVGQLNGGVPLAFGRIWMPQLGVSLLLMADGMSGMLCLLTAIVLPVIIINNWNKEVEAEGAFYGLLMLSAAGLIGVFLAADGLLFYFAWELALIPVYFLCSRWGGERRIQATFKFFAYTFAGSLLMLAGLIFVYLHTPAHSYAWADMMAAGKALDAGTQFWLFWLIFIAFAIKMPIFPFHTWQPDTYEQSPTPVTIILSALMVKMGIYAVVRWLMPLVPAGTAYWSDTVLILAVIGIIYASCIAMVQTDIKRLVAYSSIAHMGLMVAGAFAGTPQGMHGLLVQMFNHGINITGMWLLVSLIENRYGTRDMTKLGGMASSAPKMAIALVIISFANIALPLTNGFIGEFMLFHGLFQSGSPYHITLMVLSGLGVILSAVYTLTMVQRVAYGNAVAAGKDYRDLTVNEWIGLAVIIAVILALGVYPKPLLMLTSGFAGL